MAAVLFVLLLVIPVAELYVIVKASDLIGIIPTLLLLIGISIAGAWLLKREGLRTWRRLREALERGEMPTREVTDGALILLGGALLLTPGFLSDAVGLVMLVPQTRGLAKRLVGRGFGRVVKRRRAGRATVYSARVVESRRDAGVRSTRTHEERGPSSSTPAEMPSAAPETGDDSPGSR